MANPTIQYKYVLWSFPNNFHLATSFFLSFAWRNLHFPLFYIKQEPSSDPWEAMPHHPHGPPTSTCPMVWNLTLDWRGLFPNGPMFPSRVVISTPPPTLGIYLARRFQRGVSYMFLDFGPTWSTMVPNKPWFRGAFDCAIGPQVRRSRAPTSIQSNLTHDNL